MKIIRTRGKVEVFHLNDHKIGTFTYDEIWNKWILRTEHAGLDKADLKELWKIARRLR